MPENSEKAVFRQLLTRKLRPTKRKTQKETYKLANMRIALEKGLAKIAEYSEYSEYSGCVDRPVNSGFLARRRILAGFLCLSEIREDMKISRAKSVLEKRPVKGENTLFIQYSDIFTIQNIPNI